MGLSLKRLEFLIQYDMVGHSGLEPETSVLSVFGFITVLSFL
jgi:hypothetical protein